jgi:WD40 repeat protein
MAFAADAKTAVTGSWDGTIRVWDAADGRPRQVVKLPRGSVVNTIALSPDGQKLAVGGVGPVQAVHLVDLPGGKITALSPPHAQPLEFNCLAFSADGKRLLSGGGGDKAARLWDVAAGKELRQFVHQDVGQPRLRDGENPDRPEICAVAISRDGRTAAVATRSRMAASSFVHLWNVDTGEETRQIELLRGDADALAFSPDGKTLATGGYATRQGWTSDNRNLASLDLADGLQLWDVARGTLIRQFPGAPITHWRDMRKVNAVAFSPDGKLLASAEDSGVVLLYDPGTGELKSVLSGHRGEVRAVAFSGDGKKLASLGADQTVLVWDVQEALRLPAPKVE